MKNEVTVNNACRGFTLIEVLTVSILLAFFLVGFYEGSQRMAAASMVAQNRTEALLQNRRVGELWRAGGPSAISGLASGNFLNGIGYTLSTNTLPDTYSATNSTLTRLAVTLGWREIDPNSSGSLKMTLKNIYFQN